MSSRSSRPGAADADALITSGRIPTSANTVACEIATARLILDEECKLSILNAFLVCFLLFIFYGHSIYILLTLTSQDKF